MPMLGMQGLGKILAEEMPLGLMRLEMLASPPFRLQRWSLKLDFIPVSGVFKGVLPEWLEHWEMSPRVITLRRGVTGGTRRIS